MPSRGCPGRRLVAGLTVAAALLASAVQGAEPAAPTEYEVKAAFLFHFARLTEWPAAALSPGEPLRVAVLGPDPFGKVLDRTLAGQTVDGRPLRVERYPTMAEMHDAPQILFVAATQTAELPLLFKRFEGQPVLLISDRTAPLVMVAFRVTPEGKVRFDIDPVQCLAHGLKLSSQVLKLARIVPSDEGE